MHITKNIRRAYGLYAKVEIARSNVSRAPSGLLLEIDIGERLAAVVAYYGVGRAGMITMKGIPGHLGRHNGSNAWRVGHDRHCR